ncbi:hypothetical protein FisN_6Hh219 [Fistulifera solaris]|uniref:Tr-type G domain-containing protein n=1 Tax=Fistulifera solaris TaxID=1519565 RepID=A0A1Z5K2L2_FISSO|nr:hypothetical protein FisN_6Hh219 [Fistulifera solaris]|eukprot:GAX20268.1 hypothetical protein FisN_6Hh219 [Fistulifera solaris]
MLRAAAKIPRRCCRYKSSVATIEDPASALSAEIKRLRHIRNVGVFAHVDAGKTTVTERMLALAGIVHRAGSVDEGNTVTDWLPAERERGITIQSAAISFQWDWHNNRKGDDYEANDSVSISLIDNPGHVDFSVEVNRTVAVLDGAVLVVDAVAGVQAQTETVWRAMTRPSLNNHNPVEHKVERQDHAHEPLPCLAMVNKMDKEGCHFGNAIASLRQKLPGANPIPIQIPLFRSSSTQAGIFPYGVVAASANDDGGGLSGEFVGLVDLVHMRAVLWPEGNNVVENCVPQTIQLLQPVTHEAVDPNCSVTQQALRARSNLIELLADCDEEIAELFLAEEEPDNATLRMALRRATLSRKALPVVTGAALRGKGIEPLLDAIADLLPSPLDRLPPALVSLEQGHNEKPGSITVGHPLHSQVLAFAFKVVHMKGRGGSGDGRVVFARVYSGELRERDCLRVLSPPSPGERTVVPRIERIGSMLELAGGRFDRLESGVCRSGEVCALVGLKSVVTGDTILMGPEKGNKKQQKKNNPLVCLAGVAAPKPVLKVRLETDSTEQQTALLDALALLTVEDPSLVVEEVESSTLLGGLGELHIEVTLDRLKREFGINVRAGSPSVSYRETIIDDMETAGLCNFDKTIGGIRMQTAVHLLLEPTWGDESEDESACMLLSEPIVAVSDHAKTYLGLDLESSDEDLMLRSELFKSVVQGCQGAMRRGPLSSYSMVNLKCTVLDIEAEEGLSSLQAMPGSLRAASANAVATVLSENRSLCTVLEPTMSIEVSLPNDYVGTVLSDLSSRRGNVADILVGETGTNRVASKALVRGEVPLVGILGYSNSLRSLTGGEGAFTAEYKGHSPTSISL